MAIEFAQVFDVTKRRRVVHVHAPAIPRGSSTSLSGLRFHSGGKPSPSRRENTRHCPESTSSARLRASPWKAGSSFGNQTAPAFSRRAAGTAANLAGRRRTTARLADEPARSTISATDMQRSRFQYHPTWVKLDIRLFTPRRASPWATLEFVKIIPAAAPAAEHEDAPASGTPGYSPDGCRKIDPHTGTNIKSPVTTPT
jgi:hypothetical protein